MSNNDVLLREACKTYNQFADRMREQGEAVPRWDGEVCDLAGTEVLAWIELTRNQLGKLSRLERQVLALDRRLYDLERAYHQRVSTALQTMERWRQQLFGRSYS